jgi:hypothetical protein
MCRIPRTFLLSAMALLSLAALSAGPQPAVGSRMVGSGPPRLGDAAHYIVFQEQSDGTIAPVYYREVHLTVPLQTLSTTQVARALARPSRQSDHMVASLQSPAGRTVFQTIVRVPRWLRGEFHGKDPDGTIDGAWFPVNHATFVVRVPRIEGTILSLSRAKDGRLAKVARFDLNQLVAESPTIGLAATTAMRGDRNSVHSTADPANRVDLLVMGDGYTAAQAPDFSNDASALTAQFFGISPYNEYANYVNVHTLFTASTESGADHPQYDASCHHLDLGCCADPVMLSDPLRGTFVDTAFDSTYCAYNIHRLLTGDLAAVYAAAAAVPDWDLIMLLVNDSAYGGAGGGIITLAVHRLAVEIAHHEYGHSFAELADEYDDPYSAYPPCSDITGPPCEANVTDVTTRSQIKWSPWISPTTPIPTVPEFDPAYAGVVGLFEGARYLTSGMHRPGQDCIMRTLGRPYCQVPSQAYVLRLYDGGWGVPWHGIRLIEPGTTQPVASSITLTHPSTQVFRADILEPVGGPRAQITWFVDSVPVRGATGGKFTYVTSASSPSPVEITLLVSDTTRMVHPAMAGTSLQSVQAWRVWTLDAPYSVYLPFALRG